MSTIITKAAYLMKVAATTQPPPDPVDGSLASSKSLLLRLIPALLGLTASPDFIAPHTTGLYHRPPRRHEQKKRLKAHTRTPSPQYAVGLCFLPMSQMRLGLSLLDILWRVRPQPQRDVGRLHRLPNHACQILAQGIEVSLVPELGGERAGRFGKGTTLPDGRKRSSRHPKAHRRSSLVCQRDRLGTRSVRRWGSALVGTLWRSCGNAIREVSLHPPGLTVDRAREAYRGEPKTDACDARIIAHPRRR